MYRCFLNLNPDERLLVKSIAYCLLITFISFSNPVWAADDPSSPANESHFTLWQLPNQTGTQIMSYVMKTTQGALIVVDGGMPGDAPYLANFLKERGNVVEAWFISHPHTDHFSALSEILKKPGDLKIKAIYASLLPPAWIDKNASEGEAKLYHEFVATVAASEHVIQEVSPDQSFNFDGVSIEVLAVKNPEITHNGINNSSMVFKVTDSKKSVLFTGDLGVEGGEKLLKSPMAERLKADYIQMAHHGQTGVSEAFYQHVAPRFCLWPTPLWLWDVDNGGGKGSGPWKTLEVRAWMEKLSIEKHYNMHEGLQVIE